jgi:hypothetical protein
MLPDDRVLLKPNFIQEPTLNSGPSGNKLSPMAPSLPPLQIFAKFPLQ